MGLNLCIEKNLGYDIISCMKKAVIDNLNRNNVTHGLKG